MSNYQIRWRAWAASNGNTPSRQKALDRGRGYRFAHWVFDRWHEWHAETGHRNAGKDSTHWHPHTTADHNAFDTWLRKKYSLIG